MKSLLIFLAFVLCFALVANVSFRSPQSTFWIKNNSSYTFKHLYIVSSEDGDADEEYEDDGTDHCLTSCADDGNQDSLFNMGETIDLHLGKGHYDLMLQTDKGLRLIEDDIQYLGKKSAGYSEKMPFLIEDKNLKEIK
jgi:hypothetical protein